jgi:hypothetical protein
MNRNNSILGELGMYKLIRVIFFLIFLELLRNVLDFIKMIAASHQIIFWRLGVNARVL